MQPTNTPKANIGVEYDCKGERRVKCFWQDHFKAKVFYVSKFKAGKNPTVRKI